MKRVIATRKRFKCFGRGALTFLPGDNSKVLSFVREFEGEKIVVIVNLSRFSQAVELDLSKYSGMVPVEIFSQNRFPVIKNSSYVLTLGPYDHYWLLLDRVRQAAGPEIEGAVTELRITGDWQQLFEGGGRLLEEEILPAYFSRSTGFGNTERNIRSLEIVEDIEIAGDGAGPHLLVVTVTYTEGAPDAYLVGISYAEGEAARRITRDYRNEVIARIHGARGSGLLYDSVCDLEFRASLLSIILKKKKIKGQKGELTGSAGRLMRQLSGEGLGLDTELLKGQQSRSAIVYGKQLFLKLYRRFEEGTNPDIEISRFLTETARFPSVPGFAGVLEYRVSKERAASVAMLQAYAQNEGDGWAFTIDALGRYFERVLSLGKAMREAPALKLSLDAGPIPTTPVLDRLMQGFFLEMVWVLGRRTGELHLALASASAETDFAPEPYSSLYQRSLFQSMRSQVKTVLPLLRKNLNKLASAVSFEAEEILAAEQEIVAHLARIVGKKVSTMKIRIHGDFHLREVLFTGKDFSIVGFEGDRARPVSERRLKRSPLRDVASMVRSFHYAAYSAMIEKGQVRTEDQPLLERWLDPWHAYVSNAFLRSYFETVDGASFVPSDQSQIETLFGCLLLDKAIQELGYEINNCPDRVLIPIRGIKQILDSGR
jgi:maltose alpha-D-glucosyltransferase/alpha-amylase